MQNIHALDEIQGPMILKIVRKRKGPVTPGMYHAAHEAFIRVSATIMRSHICKTQLVMEVNHNRWTGMCPECRSGVVTGRRWPEARCFGCGAILINVLWPGPVEMGEIEEALMMRPPLNRHWKPGETGQKLMSENIAHGLRRVSV